MCIFYFIFYFYFLELKRGTTTANKRRNPSLFFSFFFFFFFFSSSSHPSPLAPPHPTLHPPPPSLSFFLENLISISILPSSKKRLVATGGSQFYHFIPEHEVGGAGTLALEAGSSRPVMETAVANHPISLPINGCRLALRNTHTELPRTHACVYLFKFIA